MLWRGEHMSLGETDQLLVFFPSCIDACHCVVQLFVQTEAAFETMMELGALGCLQFNDLNKNINAFQRCVPRVGSSGPVCPLSPPLAGTLRAT